MGRPTSDSCVTYVTTYSTQLCDPLSPQPDRSSTMVELGPSYYTAVVADSAKEDLWAVAMVNRHRLK